MPELEALLAEQLAQVQAALQANHRQAAGLAAEQRKLVARLRKENAELRARLASHGAVAAWEGEAVADGAWVGRSATMSPVSSASGASRKASKGTAERVAGARPTAEVVRAASLRLSLPGEVARDAGAGPARPSKKLSVFSGLGSPPLPEAPRPQRTAQPPTAVLPEASRDPEKRRVSIMLMGQHGTDEMCRRGGAKPVFTDAASMKERVRQAVFKPEYHVSNYYKEEGVWQCIARAPLFDHVTLCMIAFNALWLAVDSDYNRAPVIFDAHPVFQVAEHGFCAYFVLEWFIRFMAFKYKQDGLKDAWFVFDTCLVIFMVLESWVMAAVLALTGAGDSSGVGSVSVLKVLRLLRLTRMARMARLLRATPELMILVKGIVGAARSVFFTLLLLVGIIYIFAIAFRTMTDGTSIGAKYFNSVSSSMNTLLMRGTLPDLASLVDEVGTDHVLFAAFLLLFVLLASLTVMNMLVGVLVDIVCTVSSVEKEHMEATFLKGHLLHLLKGVDEDGDVRISKPEFQLLMGQQKAIRALQEVGVDVVGLAELSDFIYQERNDMSFPDFMETVLQLRGSNVATVKSIVDMRMFITKELARVEDNLLAKLHQVIQMDLMSFEEKGLPDPRDTLHELALHGHPEPQRVELG